MIKAWEQVFLQVLNMSITAGYCVLVVMLLRVFLQRAPKIYSYVLWAAVYFRLVCPVSIESVLSLVRVPAQVIPMDIGVQETPEISSGSQRVDTVINSGIRQVLPRAAEGDSVNPMQVVLFVAGVIWILAAAFLIIYNGYALLRLKRQLAGARWVEGNIYEAKNLQTPFVLGFFAPRIYLPSDLCGAEREYVLLHEKTHIRRRDYLVKQLAFGVTCLYWFHPLIWLAFFKMCRDMEMSCDESVIRKLGGAVKKDYSASLLALASGRQIVGGSPLAFGESGIRQRIKNILRYQRPTFWASLFFVITLALVLAGLTLSPKAVDESSLTDTETADETHPAGADTVAAGGLSESREMETGEPETGQLETGLVESRLHMHVPDYMADSEYIDAEMLPEETAEALAQRALTELYELTGTQIEECFYFYDDMGGFSFAMTKEDMDRGRVFYSRTFGEEEHSAFVSIPSIFVSNARRVGYSPVYQYDLPSDFAGYEDSQRAVWFLKQSALYNGKELAECVQPYSSMPETWQIIMEDGTSYEVSLDNEIDSVHDVTGPYPDRYISH